ncbi:hypothetical protein [Marinobacter persicus]|jgi:outer membrane murein-binding lipoprotein Lpp|uniref:Uncharacterized protein n=1 Tax=Marinobacter persicus TaxID=930118 RepID=A0A2S6G9K0_9GAMM|nr:hypothetical protein [Marinobacter persicus]PPK52928.1 hypothetical protein BY455_1032 [Marinobacter persicus]PPK55805.1 hypothetical protein B0H24_10032 [Marinobacter persicus]PPK59400.1 hypothetical protein BY454_1032 [Marinobacter persicus]
MNRKLLSTAIVAGVVTLAGCSSQPPLTPEQKAMQQQMQQAFIARMQAGTQKILNGQMQNRQPQQAAPSQPAITEEELAQKIASVQGEGQPVNIERSRDGLRIGGAPYLDPEGEITNFSANALTGDIVYAVKVGRDQIKMKYLSAVGELLPVTIGTATRSAAGQTFRSVTGQTISGNSVIGTSKGVLVTREGSAFHYVPGNATTSAIVPEGYRVAPLQKGDFASTGYMLIEKLPPEEGSVAELGSIVNSLGSSVGLAEADGYMLLHAKTGKTVKLDISIEDKDVQQMYGCKPRNSFINECAGMNVYQSMYELDGSRNTGHYFWRIDWMDTPKGPFAVVQEAGTRKINVIDLEQDQRVTVLSRTLGINSHNVEQAPDGTISIEARMGFSNKRVDDALAAYEKGMQKLAQKD